MSLDFYLQSKPKRVKCTCPDCYNQHTRLDHETYFSANITHNLCKMADKCGIYYALWRPEEKGWKKAKEIINVLEQGLVKLKENPTKYKKFNAPNGWGMYEHFVPFVEEVLEACKKYPNAKIYCSR
jgi:hypothetical protein